MRLHNGNADPPRNGGSTELLSLIGMNKHLYIALDGPSKSSHKAVWSAKLLV